MKDYRILSKIIFVLCVCGIIATVINIFTGIINSTIQTWGHTVCIMGFTISIIATVILEHERIKKAKQ